MLPDGAEAQLDDWTVFFLNQKPFNTISPVLALDSPDIQTTALPGCNAEDSKSNKPELLCVLNLVRTKHDKTLDRYVHSRHSSSLLNTITKWRQSSGPGNMYKTFIYPNFQGKEYT